MKRILFLFISLLPILARSQTTDSLDKLLQGKMGCGLVSKGEPTLLTSICSILYELSIKQFDSIKSIESATIELTRKNARLNEVIVVAYPANSCRHCGSCVSWTRFYPDSKFSASQFSSAISVYPNPLQQGQQLTIVSKEPVDGSYQIISSAGSVVQSGKAR